MERHLSARESNRLCLCLYAIRLVSGFIQISVADREVLNVHLHYNRSIFECIINLNLCIDKV